MVAGFSLCEMLALLFIWIEADEICQRRKAGSVFRRLSTRAEVQQVDPATDVFRRQIVESFHGHSNCRSLMLCDRPFGTSLENCVP